MRVTVAACRMARALRLLLLCLEYKVAAVLLHEGVARVFLAAELGLEEPSVSIAALLVF